MARLCGLVLAIFLLTLTIALPSFAEETGLTGHRQLPDALEGQTYSATLSTLALPLSLSSGSLPTGLSLNTTSGLISGTPTAEGNYAADVTDNNGKTYRVHITIGGTSFDQAVQRFDGVGPYASASYDVDLTVAYGGDSRFGGDDTQPMVVAYPATEADGAVLVDGVFPVIVLMHGSGYRGTYYRELLKRIASWGYIAVAPSRLTPEEGDGSQYRIIDDFWPPYARTAWSWISSQGADNSSRFADKVDADNLMLIGHSWGSANMAWLTITEQLPVRALVLLDGIGMLSSAKDYADSDEAIYTSAQAYPQVPILALHGHDSAYDVPSLEYTGAMSGQRVLIGAPDATHTNFLDIAHKADADDTSVSEATRELSVHAIVAFAQRYLDNKSDVIGTLFGPGAADLVELIGRTGASWAAYRPNPSITMIDDFVDGSLTGGPLDADLTVTGADDVQVGEPHRGRQEIFSLINDAYSADLLEDDLYNALVVWATQNTPVVMTWDLDGELSLEVTDYLAWEWAQGDVSTNYEPEQSPQLVLTITDANNDTVTFNADQLLTGPWTGTDRRGVMLSAADMSGIDITRITEIKLSVLSDSVDMQFELDQLRIEKNWAAFSPGDISSLVGWYDAQQLTGSDGSNVTQWDDHLDGGNSTANNLLHITEGAANQNSNPVPPTLQTVSLNGHTYRSVRFAVGAEDDYELLAANNLVSDGDTDRTIMIVYKGGSEAQGRVVGFGAQLLNNSNSAINWNLQNDGNGTLRFDGSKIDTGYATGLNSIDVFIRTAVMESATSFDEYIDQLDNNFVDTQVLDNGAPNNALGSIEGSFYVGDVNLGSPGGGDLASSFDVLEVLVFDTALSANERQSVQNWLKVKYTGALANRQIAFSITDTTDSKPTIRVESDRGNTSISDTESTAQFEVPRHEDRSFEFIEGSAQ